MTDITDAAFVTKTYYSEKNVGDITRRDHPGYSMLMFDDVFVGATMNYMVRSGGPQGISATLARAKANSSSSKGLQFAATRAQRHGIINVDYQSMLATRNNKGAFISLIEMESDAVFYELGSDLAFGYYRNTTGVRGQRKSISTNTILLIDPKTAPYFREGMVLTASPNADGSSPRTGTAKVTAVDEDGGKITVDNASNISSFADNDYLGRDGDFGLGMEGRDVCTPLTAPVLGSDSFRGKDRGAYPRRYAGSRVNDSNTSIEENLGICATYMASVGKIHMPSRAFVHPLNFWKIARRQNAKVQYDNGGGEAIYGFEFVSVSTAAGTFKVYSDPDVPFTEGHLTKEGTERLATLGGFPHLFKPDGLEWLRDGNGGIQQEWASFGNLIQDDPAAQGIIAI